MDASRFDAFARSIAGPSSRRRLLRAAAALGLGGALVGAARHDAAARKWVQCPIIACPSGKCIVCNVNEGGCICWCGGCDIPGIAGGGEVRTADGVAVQLSLIATRTEDTERAGAFFVNGQVRWVEPTWEGVGLTLESTMLASYEPMADIEGGREASGWMRTGQRDGDFPFVLRAVHAGSPGSGLDTVALWVGDAVEDIVAEAFRDGLEPSGFRYHAEGPLVSGDLQLLNFSLPNWSDGPAIPAS